MDSIKPNKDQQTLQQIEEFVENIIYLKTDKKFFEWVWSGKKTFEVRKNDRDYQIGSVLVLREYKPKYDKYTGRAIAATVSYFLTEEDYPQGIMPGYVILALQVIAQEQTYK